MHDCVLSGWANAFKIGTETERDFHLITFRDSIVKASVESNPGTRNISTITIISDDGANVHDETVENIHVRQSFARKLECFFKDSIGQMNSRFPDLQYWHGNEPGLYAPYLFNYAGRPDLTQKWVRWIMANKYFDDPDGLDGNDDGGTLSAWYIFRALGFYPVPCTEDYLISSPIFPRAVVRVPGGELVIVAENTSSRNIYVQSVEWNW